MASRLENSTPRLKIKTVRLAQSIARMRNKIARLNNVAARKTDGVPWIKFSITSLVDNLPRQKIGTAWLADAVA